MSKLKQDTLPFSSFLQSIKDELREKNLEYTSIMEDVLSKDGDLAFKTKFGQKIILGVLPETGNDKPRLL